MDDDFMEVVMELTADDDICPLAFSLMAKVLAYMSLAPYPLLYEGAGCPACRYMVQLNTGKPAEYFLNSSENLIEYASSTAFFGPDGNLGLLMQAMNTELMNAGASDLIEDWMGELFWVNGVSTALYPDYLASCLTNPAATQFLKSLLCFAVLEDAEGPGMCEMDDIMPQFSDAIEMMGNYSDLFQVMMGEEMEDEELPEDACECMLTPPPKQCFIDTCTSDDIDASVFDQIVHGIHGLMCSSEDGDERRTLSVDSISGVSFKDAARVALKGRGLGFGGGGDEDDEGEYYYYLPPHFLCAAECMIESGCLPEEMFDDDYYYYGSYNSTMPEYYYYEGLDYQMGYGFKMAEYKLGVWSGMIEENYYYYFGDATYCEECVHHIGCAMHTLSVHMGFEVHASSGAGCVFGHRNMRQLLKANEGEL